MQGKLICRSKVFRMVGNIVNGTVEFELSELEAGAYDIRVYDADDGGVELGYVSFSIIK